MISLAFLLILGGVGLLLLPYLPSMPRPLHAHFGEVVIEVALGCRL